MIRRKEREKEVAAQRELHESKIAREREKLRYDEEIKQFSALLAEHVSSAKYSWNEIRNKISHDTRSQTQFLSSQDKERLFFQRLQSLQGSRDSQFLQFIQDHPMINAGSTWEESRRLFSDDPRFTGFDRDKSKQYLFENHIEKLKSDATARFIDMLWGFNKIKKGIQVGSKDYNHIKAMLKDDAAWKGLDYLPEHRDTVFEQHIKNVNNGAERPKQQNAPQLGDWVVNLKEQNEQQHGHGRHGGRGGHHGDRGDRDRPYGGGDRPYHGGDRPYHGGGERFQRPRDPRADVRIETKVIPRERPQAPAGTDTRGFERR